MVRGEKRTKREGKEKKDTETWHGYILYDSTTGGRRRRPAHRSGMEGEGCMQGRLMYGRREGGLSRRGASAGAVVSLRKGEEGRRAHKEWGGRGGREVRRERERERERETTGTESQAAKERPERRVRGWLATTSLALADEEAKRVSRSTPDSGTRLKLSFASASCQRMVARCLGGEPRGSKPRPQADASLPIQQRHPAQSCQRRWLAWRGT